MISSAPVHGRKNLDVAHQAPNDTKPRRGPGCFAATYGAGRLYRFLVIVGHLGSFLKSKTLDDVSAQDMARNRRTAWHIPHIPSSSIQSESVRRAA